MQLLGTRDVVAQKVDRLPTGLLISGQSVLDQRDGHISDATFNLVTEAAPEDSFRLARHLDYLGRSTRQHIYPDPAFWRTARTVFLGANVLSSLARAAEDRQRYATAAALYAASPTSNPHRLRSLALLYARGGQYRQAVETARQATQEGDTTPLRVLAKRGLPGYPTQDLYRLAASAGDGHAPFC